MSYVSKALRKINMVPTQPCSAVQVLRGQKGHQSGASRRRRLLRKSQHPLQNDSFSDHAILTLFSALPSE